MDWWKNTLVLSSKRKIVLEWLELEIVLEQTLLSFLLLSLRLLIDAAQKKTVYGGKSWCWCYLHLNR